MIALYVGLQAEKRSDKQVLHLPLIQVVPKPFASFEQAFKATHIIMTSKTAVEYSRKHLPSLSDKQFISVGQSTTRKLEQAGIRNILTAKNECQEGIIELIERLSLKDPCFFWPHSSRSRSVLRDYFEKRGCQFTECHLYDTLFKTPECRPNFAEVSEIHFTSPSTVEAFFHFFGPPPAHATLCTKGPITKACLDSFLASAIVVR
jgi:hydroxymethylbilane synthase